MDSHTQSLRLAAVLALDEPVSKVHSVSPNRARALSRMGITTVRNLLENFPRRYIDLSLCRTIQGAGIGESCTIRGSIHKIVLKKPKPHLQLVEITVVDGSGTLMVTCFRQPWLMEQFKAGDAVTIAGKVEYDYGFKRMKNPFLEKLGEQGDAAFASIIPVHPACDKVSAAWMRRLILNALEMTRMASDPLPLDIRTSYRLMGKAQAYRAIHFPQSMDEMRQAKRRLAFEEVLNLELRLMQEERLKNLHRQASVHVVEGPLLEAFFSQLPFEPTKDQRQAVEDIKTRMAAQRPMNHLLLGDVGTGKTVVAAAALVIACQTGNQAVLMAPTEVLATQHAKSIGSWLDELGIPWALLTGSTSADERRRILSGLADGTIQVALGTHALLEDDVSFSCCSLVVIDEQQRFGVAQRETLVNKGAQADALFLTATPIPRTLALALYGNLTLSYLKERPAGRAPRITSVLTKDAIDIAYTAAREAFSRGEQAYVICPLIGAPTAPDADDGKTEEHYEYASIAIEDEGDIASDSLSPAIREAEFLREKVFSEFRVGLIHGQMPSADKSSIMAEFGCGKLDVLVSTTVIEVGIDVPNATVMIIHDAERFGLSQLHQLRGRVGRGSAASQVFLISGSTSEPALKRLRAMETSDDGFELAKYDLSLRREGDILGNRQHGASSLKLVNVARDGKMIEAAHGLACRIMDEDAALEKPEHLALARELRMVLPDDSVRNGG